MQAAHLDTDLSQWTRCTSTEVPEPLAHLLSDKQWNWAVRRRFATGIDKSFARVGRGLLVNPRRLGEQILAGALDPNAQNNND